MKKVVIGSLALASMVVLSSCGLVSDKKDAMEKETMIKQEMMEKDNEKMIQAEGDAMIKIEGDAMMKKEGDYTAYSESLLDEALASGKKVVLFFHAPWCPSCKSADTNLKEETLSPDIIVFKTDYDSNVELKKKYGVTYQHTFVSLNSDGSLLKKASGLSTAAEIGELF